MNGPILRKGRAHMTTIVAEVYEALTKLGLEDGLARAAATAVLAATDKDELATKSDFAILKVEWRADLTELKADLGRQNNMTLIALTAIFGGLVTILKLFG